MFVKMLGFRVTYDYDSVCVGVVGGGEGGLRDQNR
jgi:hypothetical protein